MQKITISASSHVGLVREHNEDAILVSHQYLRDAHVNTSAFLSADERYVVAVCDGLGGQNAGEVASMDVVEQLSRRIDTLPSGLTSDSLCQTMKEWVAEEHDYLLAVGRNEAMLDGMGTTMVALLFYEGRIFWMNCGDSRLYRMRNGVLRQISQDHSLFQLTHQPADAHIITNCLGGGASDVFLDICDISNESVEGDVFLLCSDGLTDMLGHDEIESLLAETSDASVMTDRAVQNGGVDNVSVCVLSIDCWS